MKQIQPVVFPLNLGVADNINVNILNNPNIKKTVISYILLDSSFSPAKMLTNGFFNITDEEFVAHGNDKEWITNYAVEQLGITLI